MTAGKLSFSNAPSVAVTTDWQDSVSTSGKPGQKSRTQPGKFISCLEEQCQLLVASSRSLGDELFSSLPHFSVLSAQLTVQSERSKAIDGELTESLCHSLITPIDCEDLKRLSHVIHKLTATQLRLAQTFHAVAGTAYSYVHLQEEVVQCTDALFQAVQALNTATLPNTCSNLHICWRKARTSLRQMHQQQWADEGDVRHRLTEQLLYFEFSAELGYVKAAYDTLMRARLKNG